VPEEELGHLRIFARAPQTAAAWIGFLRALHAARTLPPRLIEVVRLRIAYHNQCPHCMAIRIADGVADGVTEELVCSLEAPADTPDLTEAEQSALRYADLMATNHKSIDEGTFDDLRRHFTEPEIVELGVQIAVFVGFGRLGSGWRLTDDIPDRYAEAELGELHFAADSVRIGAVSDAGAGVG
jgi:AhpD family alkylhydroperoxidase